MRQKTARDQTITEQQGQQTQPAKQLNPVSGHVQICINQQCTIGCYIYIYDAESGRDRIVYISDVVSDTLCLNFEIKKIPRVASPRGTFFIFSNFFYSAPFGRNRVGQILAIFMFRLACG
jgi:hypothetical protein